MSLMPRSTIIKLLQDASEEEDIYGHKYCQKQIVTLLQALCKTAASRHRLEVAALVSQLRAARAPPHFLEQVPPPVEERKSDAAGSSLLEHLTTPILGPLPLSGPKTSSSTMDLQDTLSQPSLEIKVSTFILSTSTPTGLSGPVTLFPNMVSGSFEFSSTSDH
ncbi:hypothetical protein LAZ67_2006355 [Cordylochernes scorpioides]|uniref:Uncharacterized protein n=1 Tax=Cordylochernes scorpioides TaxID=51811 RepID=A0ABY6K626_9ARAC|nr:hypothetical protein LAZ67_2006355 [Cordylochernes scorpioides]